MVDHDVCVLNGDIRKRAEDQHKDLRTSLLDQGWGKVKVYPVNIVNAGTITSTANDALQALGVDAAARMTLLKRLAIDSLRRTAEIWKPRIGQRTSTGAPPRPVPSPTRPGNPDAPDPMHPSVQEHNNNIPPAADPAATTHNASDSQSQHVLVQMQSDTVSSTSPQPPADLQTNLDTDDMPWHIVTRSRARRTGAADNAEPGQASQQELHEQARPSKRRRNRFAVLEHDDALQPGSDDAQPTCRVSHSSPSVTAQDEATQADPCVHDACPRTSLSPDTNAQSDAGAPQPLVTPQADDGSEHIASQPRRSERIKAQTLSQQTTDTESYVLPSREPAIIDQDDTPDAIPSASDSCPQTSLSSDIDTDDRANAMQRSLARRHDIMQPTSQLRRSTRLQAVSQSQQQQATPILSATASPTAPLQSPRQHIRSVFQTSSKRKPAEAFHMTLRRPTARRRTEQTLQPSLQTGARHGERK